MIICLVKYVLNIGSTAWTLQQVVLCEIDALILGITVTDQSKHGSGPSSPPSMTGLSFGTIVRKAASVASVAAKQAYAAAAATRDGSDEEMLPLKCCLMSVSLPWDHIAQDLLFKVV